MTEFNRSTTEEYDRISEKSLKLDAKNIGKIKVANEKACEAKRTDIKNKMDSWLNDQWLTNEIAETWEL